MSIDRSHSKHVTDAPKKGGPKTEAGRKKSAANSLRHGVLSDNPIVLQSESNAEYVEFRRNYYESLQPVGFIEQELVDEMIWARWRQRRSIVCESASIDQQMDAEAPQVERKIIDIDDATRTAHAIQTLSNESNDLALLSRYETRLHRMYYRALRQLLDLQDRRKRDGQPLETKPPAPALEPENQKLPNELPPPVPQAKPAAVIDKKPSVPSPVASRPITSAPGQAMKVAWNGSR